MKKISSCYIYRNKIDYTATANLYIWYLWISRIRFIIQSGVFHLMRLFVMIFLPHKYLNRFYRRHIESMRAQDILFGDIECGDDILTSMFMVKLTFAGYLILPISIVISIICTLLGWDVVLYCKEGIIYFVIVLILVGLLLIILRKSTKTFDVPQNHISYFKKFKKKDEEWLKKWKIYTILLLLGAILSAAMSFGFCCLCITIYRNIHGPFN